ncbi:MAG: leucine-rich repeat domain-containing protein [Kiritimatiellae bacterium]|nr:leucine-rich repeat domain-containing protein [Kiritimatiellia bacterium]
MMRLRHILAALAAFALTLPALATWTYTPGAGNQNNQPYSGIISDGNWQIRVYQPDASSSDFYLGCGGNGSGARVAGSGALDLSTLLADTTAAGTPVRAVNVAPHFMNGQGGNLTGVVLPDTVTNIANVAFNGCNNSAFKSINLSNTQIRSIGGYAFAWCQNLAEVWLPKTLEYVGKCAFRTMPSKVTLHFAGDVPYLEPPSSNGYGSNYSAYTSSTEYQNIFNGGGNVQWALCVNAQKYPNWTRIGKASYYDEENPFPSNEASWPPSQARAIEGYTAPFGNTWFSRTSDTSPSGRTYLIQEGTWSGAAVARPFLGEPVADAKRTAITNTIPLSVGSSPSVTVTYTFGSETQTLTVTEDTVLVFGFEDLPDSTTYNWSITVTGESGRDSAAGAIATVTPDIVLGEPTAEYPKDGKSATISVPVTSLLSASGRLEFTLNGEPHSSLDITATGTYPFLLEDLELGQTYEWSVTATAGSDADSKSGSFVAERYKWTYTPGAGTKDGKPYTGTISDKNWTIYVYQPDAGSDAFWLGCGGAGYPSRVTGSGELDLTQVLDDTTEVGTPVRLVRVARYAFQNQSVESLILPHSVTNLGQVCFENSGVKKVDLSQTTVQSIEAFAFSWTQVREVWLPKTLKFIGGFAFRNCGEKAVFHFAGPPPELELLTENVGTQYGAYIQLGTYQNIWNSGANKQHALCVDYKTYPQWANLDEPWTTTYYEPVAAGVSFPSGEASWIPEAVRYTVNADYKAPFGTTNYGRATDTSTNGRTYLIYEKHGTPGLFIIVR